MNRRVHVVVSVQHRATSHAYGMVQSLEGLDIVALATTGSERVEEPDSAGRTSRSRMERRQQEGRAQRCQSSCVATPEARQS